MNPQEQQKINNCIISQLSSKECYFFVYPFTKRELIASELQKHMKLKVPIVLVYSNNDSLSFGQLLSKFLAENNLPNLKKAQGFQLEHNIILRQDKTIADVKAILRNDNINGLQLYPYVYNQLDSNQVSYKECIQAQQFFNKGDVELQCEVCPVGYPFYIKIRNDFTIETIRKLMIQEIQRIFGKQLKAQKMDIEVFFEKNWKPLADNFITRLNKSNKFKVTTKNIDLSLPIQNKCQIIIKGSQIKTVSFDYNIKKHRKVGHLLQELYPNQKPDYWDTYGLLVDKCVIKNNQSLQKIGHLFLKSTLSSKHFVANLLKQQCIFELEQEKIKSKTQINPNYMESIIVEDKTNLKHHKECEKEIRDRAANAPHVWFRDKKQHVQPILWYTSQLKVKPSQTKKNNKISSLFDTLNTFLRQQNFAKVDQAEYQKWEYIFESELLQKLKKLPPVTDQELWRGVSHKPEHKIGQKILYKQFISTSTQKYKAFEFAVQAIFKLKKSFSGSNVEEYTYFKKENQVLFPPYTEFIVTSVGKMKNQLFDSEIDYFEIEQLPKQPLPTNKVRFILWVDDKTLEGKLIWDDFKHIEDTTMMIQLINNQELRSWFYKNQYLLKDQSVEIVMITNMTRQQKGVILEEAGIDSIKIFKGYLPKNHILVYIGWLQGNLQKLEKHKYSPSQTLRISNDQQELRDFLNKKVNIK